MRYICLDKVYYEAAIIGTGGLVEDVRVVDSLSPELMNLVISKFVNKFGTVLNQQGAISLSDRLSRDTTMSFGDAATTTLDKSSSTDGTFEQLMSSAFQLSQFLNFASLAFDGADYAAIRDFLKLPSKNINARSNALDCGCKEHRRKARRSSGSSINSLWRTYDKMSRCAKKLNVNLPPPTILSQLNDLSFAFNCQRTFPISNTKSF